MALLQTLQSLQVSSHQDLIRIIKTLDLSVEKIAHYRKSPDEMEYGRNVIYKTDELEVLVLHFPPLTKTPVHDHGRSSGCVYIVEGQLQNVLYRSDCCDASLMYDRTEDFRQGEMVPVHNDMIHMMQNVTMSPVTTFHIYSPPLEEGRVYSPDM
ncbi:cysteine dioxygenase [Shouchella lonarensis]|uniref:Cysteine dioxygenase n=1 Tax=Shouchella lonarensis TaxID=1464122 RepID=A0A1G6HD90_9BACI|nr:cysteine dioxygenase family protein [Shouchella lonarensis]SDB92249.1 cysteine dioxygenase [Shouchella lonarensis]